MGGQDQGLSACGELLLTIPDQVACLWIEARGRFVEDDDVRVLDQRSSRVGIRWGDVDPVSYTHLDVYKRQSRDRARRVARSG